MQFKVLSKAITQQFAKLIQTGLFLVDVDGVADEEERMDARTTEEIRAAPEDKPVKRESLLWKTYLASFPPGSDPVYKTKTEHDCSCCRGFIKRIGPVVSVVDGKIATVWDVDIDGPYKVVCEAMAALVRRVWAEKGIKNEFFHKTKAVGVEKSRAQFAPGEPVITFDHFSVTLPDAAFKEGALLGPARNLARTGHDVLLRALRELTPESVDSVLDLIAQKSLYRGDEQKFVLTEFQKLQNQFLNLKTPAEQDLFAWVQRNKAHAAVVGIRNSAVGTLLVDISDGLDLDDAVRKFGTKMDPNNYRHPTTIASKRQIDAAKKDIEEQGYMSALQRRYATIEDINVNNVRWRSREARRAMKANDIFDDLKARLPEKIKNLDRVEEIGVDAFMENVLPRAESLEVLVENRHESKFVSLIAPEDPTAKNIFKHGNRFSWSYAGDLADSIKEKVKKEGGKVDGDFRASIAWRNLDDLDLWLREPSGYAIGFNTARHPNTAPKTGGFLDVDYNGLGPKGRQPVENIVYPNKSRMAPGEYILSVHQYRKNESIDGGFEAEIEFDGKLWSFSYPNHMHTGQRVEVARFRYDHKSGLEMITSLETTAKDAPGKVVWGIPTQTFRPVDVVMFSPNHWEEGVGVGHKHLFFMLAGCLREDTARGFLNEYLIEDLNKHRKVLHQIGAKMRTEKSERQLSGLGFSTTQKDSVVCRVKGASERVIKVVF